MEPEPTNQTTRTLLNILKTEGPADAVELSKHLGISAIAVRQYLVSLEQRGLVTYYQESRSLGRPARLWQLTSAADVFFPEAHAALASSLLKSAEKAFGADGLRQMLSESVREQIERYRDQIPTNTSLDERLQALASLRNQDGYMAEIKKEKAGSFLLIENHCPILRAAKQCSQLCEAELQIFQSVLGNQTRVQREEHMLGKSCRCVYRVEAGWSCDQRASETSEPVPEAV